VGSCPNCGRIMPSSARSTFPCRHCRNSNDSGGGCFLVLSLLALACWRLIRREPS
jgi:hypothetical protein